MHPMRQLQSTTLKMTLCDVKARKISSIVAMALITVMELESLFSSAKVNILFVLSEKKN